MNPRLILSNFIQPPALLAAMVLPLMSTFATEAFPEVSQLPSSPDLPDPLILFNGRRVTRKAQWFNQRRPELKALFQHYMYGATPPAPEKINAAVERVDRNFFGGKATKKEVTISFGPPNTPRIHLLLVVPNQRKRPAPAFVGLNFCGNHTLLPNTDIALPAGWMPRSCPGVTNSHATDAGRGKQADVWALEQSIDRGYAVATFYNGDVEPDRPDASEGIRARYGSHDWGTIAA